jgi:DNA polymerase-1
MPTDPQRPLIIVDGSAYLFRAYHGLPPLTNANGVPTGAIFGVLNMLKKLTLSYPNASLVVVFDPKGKTTRHGLFPAYKANRSEMPDELACQIAPLHAIIQALGLPLCIAPGIEADDVIGTLATQTAEQGQAVIIATGDKDFAQLVSTQITLVNTMNDSRLDPAGVVTKFGIRPDQIIDYLALIGDTSDNIPGVPKVGPKTAVKWLSQYDSISGIIAHAEAITGKVGQSLRDHLDQLALSQQLVTIDCQIDLPKALSLTRGPVDEAALTGLLQEYQIRPTVVAPFRAEPANPLEATPAQKKKQKNYTCLRTEADYTHWIKQLEAAPYFALDTETTGLDVFSDTLVGIAFALPSGAAAYLPLGHTGPEASQQLTREQVFPALSALLNRPDRPVVGQHLKFDLQVLSQAGITVTSPVIDTLLYAYLIEGSARQQDLASLASRYLQREMMDYATALTLCDAACFSEVSLSVATDYAAEDAEVTCALYDYFHTHYAAELPESLLTDIEWPLVPVLARMEHTGVLVDASALHAQSQALGADIQAQAAEIIDQVGYDFNIDSTKQLRAALFEHMGLPVLKKTKTKQASTAEPVLQALANDHPIAALILSYRSLAKLKSTYTDKLPQQIHPATGRIHTHYIQNGTATGRLASKDPNLQNIPIKTAAGRRVRQAFVARPNHCLLAADYSQIELRIMAHFSQDEALLSAFHEGLDIHARTAADLFAVPLEAVSDTLRRQAKAINFGLIYGMSSFGLAKQLQVSRAFAQDYMDRYFETYPGVAAYMTRIRTQAKADGFVTTCTGRRLPVPNIDSSKAMERQAAERAAINAPLQGSAADIIKRAMIAVDQAITAGKLPAHMIMQVHDELVFEVHESALTALSDCVKNAMENTTSLSVPMTVALSHGGNWDEAHA